MITDSDIAAGRLPLSNSKVMALLLLVRRLPEYRQQPGRWPNLQTKIEAVRGEGDPDAPAAPADPTMADVQGMALDAVLARLKRLPGVVVQDEGSDTEKYFFSSAENWEELARDVLDVLYEATGGNQTYRLVQRTLEMLLATSSVGSRRRSNDELYRATAYRGGDGGRRF